VTLTTIQFKDGGMTLRNENTINWTKEQLKLAFYLYCQTPFGKLHSRNPAIIELSKLIGRTPSALAMKLVNFASLDPSITASGRVGLRSVSKLVIQYGMNFTRIGSSLLLSANSFYVTSNKKGKQK